jgi:hypothetical protein
MKSVEGAGVVVLIIVSFLFACVLDVRRRHFGWSLATYRAIVGSITPVYGRFRASGNRPDVYVGLGNAT